MEVPANLAAAEMIGHLGYLLTLCAYLVRDILMLRALIVVACATMAVYFAVAMAEVAWTPFVWQMLLLGVNVVWIMLLLQERRGIHFTEEEQELRETLFREFNAVEFMKLVRAGDWIDLEPDDLLTIRSQPVDRLYLVTSGEVEVEREPDKPPIRVRDGTMIGEMSFVSNNRATATVRAIQPTRCLAWKQEELAALLRRNPSMRGVVMWVIGSDLTRKLTAPAARLA